MNEQSIEDLQDNLEKDSRVIDMAIKSQKESNIIISEMRAYNENLKASFDAAVQETAMKIIGGNDAETEGAGTLKYTN